MDKYYEMVKDFHEKFNRPTSDSPKYLGYAEKERRYLFMQEELMEFMAAPDIYEQADAMIDLIYFALGTMVEMGVKPQKLFEIVHDANMKKLWPDGKAHYNELGKVVKPERWQDPYPHIKKAIDTF